MGIKARARNVLNSICKRYGYELLPSSLLYDWQRCPQTQPSHKRSTLPEGAEHYLVPDHPRLKELRERYAGLDAEVTVALVWKEGHVRPDDLRYFRGDNAYVWQLRGQNMGTVNYALTTFYLASIDKLGLLQQLREDDYFGNVTFFVDSKQISRDLLDSITEIYFLEKHLRPSFNRGMTILDIGAGYGRLAHRMLEAFPNIQTYLCTDAIPVSTFISEYYLRFRGLENRAKVVPIDEIESTLENQTVDLAVNIHSFSECGIPSVEWWLSLLEKHRIKYLMIVPNATDYGGELLLTHDRQDISKVVEKHGYKLMVKEPKFRDSVVQEYGINPTYYHLFELC